VIGTYHHMSEAHLHRYTTESDFRYNTRTLTDAERTAEALKGARGKRLTTGNLLRSQPGYYEHPRLFGERRKRWTKS
jgi:hypothetical protein